MVCYVCMSNCNQPPLTYCLLCKMKDFNIISELEVIYNSVQQVHAVHTYLKLIAS